MGIISGILDVSRRSLNAQSLVIRTIGDNISNVNTPGYSRRKAELVTTQSSGTGNLVTGTGVEVRRVVRAVDDFINREYVGRISDRAGSEIRQDYLLRAEQPFELANSPGHIAYEMSRFFSSLQDLANSPADLPLRTQLIQSGQALTTSIRDTYNHLARLQREADTRIGDVVTQINTLSSQVAAINKQIVSGETASQQNLTLRDKRDELIRQLGELVPITTLEDNSGQVQVTMPQAKGFALVRNGESQALTFTQSPDFTTFQGGLDGAALGNVVYEYDPTTANTQVDFTSALAGGSGQLGALLKVRGYFLTNTENSPFDAVGDLPEVAGRVELIARDLLTRFNDAYRGYDPAAVNAGDENTSNGVWDPSAGGLDDMPIDDSAPTTIYTPPAVFGLFTSAAATSDFDGDGHPTDSDLNNLAGLDPRINFASTLNFGVSDERQFAAALDLDPADLSLSFSPGDARNVENLLALRDNLVFYGTYQVGNFAGSSTIEDLYRQTTGYLGGLANAAKSDYEAFKSREEQVKELYSSTTGVSLDEEFAKLINFQRGFEASARMVRVGDQMFQEIIGLLG